MNVQVDIYSMDSWPLHKLTTCKWNNNLPTTQQYPKVIKTK